jgi:hypothetical protein
MKRRKKPRASTPRERDPVESSAFHPYLRHFLEWFASRGYELYQRQLMSYQPGNEKASEHFRNGAFHWWLTRDLSDEMLIKLIFLTAQDPDRMMARDVRGYILRRPGLPTRMAEFLTLYETLETELEPD